MGVPGHFRSWQEIHAESFLTDNPVCKLVLSAKRLQSVQLFQVRRAYLTASTRGSTNSWIRRGSSAS
jgi:hypothetical protein